MALSITPLHFERRTVYTDAGAKIRPDYGCGIYMSHNRYFIFIRTINKQWLAMVEPGLAYTNDSFWRAWNEDGPTSVFPTRRAAIDAVIAFAEAEGLEDEIS